MKGRSFIAGIVAAFVSTSAGASSAPEELRVLSAVGMRQVLVELAPAFERATGHTLRIAFDSGAMIVRRIDGGERADVLLLPHDAAQRLADAHKAVAGSLTELASSRVGLAIREGAARPDISSADAFKATLLAAASIARPDPAQGGSSGVHIQRVLERLGIASQIAGRTILSSRPDREDEMPAQRVARGEAALALHQIQELQAVPGITVIGPFPGDLDGRFLFSGVVATGTAHQRAAHELLAFLTSAQAQEVMKARGMEPAPGGAGSAASPIERYP